MLSENYINKIKESIKNKFSDMGIDDDSIQELADVSIESLEEELKNVQAILETDDLTELGFHTHTIKGVLLNIGLNDDAERFKEIKHLFENGKSNEEIKEITKERISIFF